MIPVWWAIVGMFGAALLGAGLMALLAAHGQDEHCQDCLTGVMLARQAARLREEQMAYECGSREAAGLPALTPSEVQA